MFAAALPTLDIGEGALNKLMNLHKELLPAMGGYLTHAGQLDRKRLQMLLSRIGQMEQETLEERAAVGANDDWIIYRVQGLILLVIWGLGL